MNPLIASLFLAVLPVSKPAEPIDVERMIEAICQIEGGSWSAVGGAGCLSYIAWEQHRPNLSYQLSASKEHAMPVYREHLHWLIFNLPRNRIKVTPASLYTCWRYGLDGGIKRLRSGIPAQAVRCQNLYEDFPAR